MFVFELLQEFIIDEIQALKNERLDELEEFLDKVEEEIKFEAIQILQTVKGNSFWLFVN